MYLIDISVDAVDILREIGGVAFVFNLSKPGIVHSDVKITALFTLGALAEANGELIKQMLETEMVLQSYDPNKASAFSAAPHRIFNTHLFSIIYTSSVLFCLH